MNTLHYKKLDAFASSKSSGNPAGVIYLEQQDDLNAKQMLQIAKEQKGFVSEVGFIWEKDDGSFGLRYYSSEREVAFCGHATVAIMYDFIKDREELLHKEEVVIHTKNDTLHVKNMIASTDAVFVTAPQPKFYEKNIDKDMLAKALNIDKQIIDETQDISIVDAGLQTLIVPIDSLENILYVEPELEVLKEYCLDIGVDIILLYTKNCFNQTNSYRTRVFAATFGYLEDPATGSGNSAFGYYLLKQNDWDGKMMSIEQNGLLEHYNTIKLVVQEKSVLFGGNAVKKIDGFYFL